MIVQDCARTRMLLAAALGISAMWGSLEVAQAQITVPRVLSTQSDRTATLEEQLINQLRAASVEQRGFVRYVVKQVQEGKLETRLVIAIQRYSQQRYPDYPFPMFERAMRISAERYGVALPPSRSFADSVDPAG